MATPLHAVRMSPFRNLARSAAPLRDTDVTMRLDEGEFFRDCSEEDSTERNNSRLLSNEPKRALMLSNRQLACVET